MKRWMHLRPRLKKFLKMWKLPKKELVTLYNLFKFTGKQPPERRKNFRIDWKEILSPSDAAKDSMAQGEAAKHFQSCPFLQENISPLQDCFQQTRRPFLSKVYSVIFVPCAW